MKPFLPFISLLFSFFGHASTECLETRAAFDLGSGSTKMKVAHVNICQKKILTILDEDSLPVPYKQDLSHSKDQSFSTSVMQDGINALRILKKKVDTHTPKRIFASATEAFRKATNAPTFLSKIKKEINLDVSVISQEEEATMGFSALISQASAKPKTTISWDIGGGSMQIAAQNENGKMLLYKGIIAAISFKNEIISLILKKDPKKISSPNPMKEQQIKHAIALARNLASEIPEDVRNKIQKKGMNAFGIGDVHSKSVIRWANPKGNFYTKSMARSAIKKLTGLTDKQIGGNYADTELTNLILVLGFMEALHIKKVRTANINMSDGLLLKSFE